MYAGMILSKAVTQFALVTHLITVLLNSSQQQFKKKIKKAASAYPVTFLIISGECRAIFLVLDMSIFPQKHLYREYAMYHL